MSKPTKNWQNVLWRAWRHTNDEEFADQLFATVADEPVGWGHLLLLGALYGAAAGLLVGLVATNGGVEEDKDLVVSWLRLASFVAWGAGIGALGAGLIRWVAGRRLTWRAWLKRLLPSDPQRSWFSAQDVYVPDVYLPGVLGWLGVRRNVRPGEGSGLGGGLGALLGWGAGVDASGVLGGVLGALLGGGLGALLGAFLGGGLDGVLVVVRVVSRVGGLVSGLVGGLVGLVGVLVGGLFGGLVGGLFGVLVGGLEGNCYAWKHRRWLVWWRGRPHLFALEQALVQAGRPWTGSLGRLETARSEGRPPGDWVAALRNPGWEERFIARHALVSLGGEAMEPLRALLRDWNAALSQTAADLIRDIAQDTTARLAATASCQLCPHCLVRCHTHSVRLSWRSRVTYYGCRACGQSREWIDWPGEVVAVLDQGMRAERLEQDGTLRVNWLARNAMFDFDRVEIVNATDEEVERFLIEVGNDPDEFRRRRYRQMPCVVHCPLEEITWRRLRDQLGPVEDATREEGVQEKGRMRSAELAVGDEEMALQRQHDA